jgi:hypothetical protein
LRSSKSGVLRGRGGGVDTQCQSRCRGYTHITCEICLFRGDTVCSVTEGWRESDSGCTRTTESSRSESSDSIVESYGRSSDTRDSKLRSGVRGDVVCVTGSSIRRGSEIEGSGSGVGCGVDDEIFVGSEGAGCSGRWESEINVYSRTALNGTTVETESCCTHIVEVSCRVSCLDCVGKGESIGTTS